MKIGCISYCFKGEKLEEMLGKFREVGFKNVELWLGHPDGLANYNNADREGARSVRELIQGYGITPQSYCIGGFSDGDPLQKLKKAFQYANGLGVSVITGCATPKMAKELDQLCQEYGIRFAIENHKGNVFESPADYFPTLGETSEWIGVTMDSGHFALASDDPVEAAKKLKGRIYHVHLKDVVEGRTCILGKGEAKIEELLLELLRQGYKGHLSIEHEVEGDPTKDLKESLKFCSEVLEKEEKS